MTTSLDIDRMNSMKIALIVILAAPLAIVPAEAYPHHQITDAERYDCLMTDEDPDGRNGA